MQVVGWLPVIGKTLSRYQITEKLGGGVGVVNKAEDTRLGRFVSLKVLPDDLPKGPHTLQHFEREAKARKPWHLVSGKSQIWELRSSQWS